MALRPLVAALTLSVASAYMMAPVSRAKAIVMDRNMMRGPYRQGYNSFAHDSYPAYGPYAGYYEADRVMGGYGSYGYDGYGRGDGYGMGGQGGRMTAMEMRALGGGYGGYGMGGYGGYGMGRYGGYGMGGYGGYGMGGYGG